MTRSRRKTPKCRCVSSAGIKKQRFMDRDAAVTVAIRRGWPPHTYRCPSGKGFHLTKG